METPNQKLYKNGLGIIYRIVALFGACTLSEHAPLLEYRHTEVNQNIYNIGVPAFSINSQNAVFRL